jgi:Family of unknown function (DUF5993)
MMAGLFILFLIVMFLIGYKKRIPALAVMLVTIALCALMLLHHATDFISIRL